jgi:hypothetical protein
VNASVQVDDDALLCALVLAPTSFSRNRFFGLFEQPERKKLRRRAARIRGIIRQLVHPERGRSEILTFVEDVGRHNAVDAIAGQMWLDRIDGGDKIFYTTGRLTSEMVIKAAQMGIPFLVSRSGLTQMGHEIAEKVGITMIGRATGKHFLLFTGAGRFRAEPSTVAR